MTRLAAIKEYFGSNGYPKVTYDELKALSKDDREELAIGSAKELGVEITIEEKK